MGTGVKYLIGVMMVLLGLAIIKTGNAVGLFFTGYGLYQIWTLPLKWRRDPHRSSKGISK